MPEFLSMARHRPRGKKQQSALWKRRVKQLGISLLGTWFLAVLLLRTFPPPSTPLMALRALEYWVRGSPVVQHWEWVSLSDIPQRVQQAVVAAEDSRFMLHWGVDFGALDEVLDEANGSKQVRGASTITMQTVKNVFLWPGRSYVRKVLEGLMTPIAGAIWGKRRTLELYLNVVEWGTGIYGVQAASRHYFRKPVRELSLDEASSLAAILPSPRKINPHSLTAIARKRFVRIRSEAYGTRIPG